MLQLRFFNPGNVFLVYLKAEKSSSTIFKKYMNRYGIQFDGFAALDIRVVPSP